MIPMEFYSAIKMNELLIHVVSNLGDSPESCVE